MIPAHLSAQGQIAFHHGGPAEFPSPDYQRPLQQPALLQVADQGCRSLVRETALFDETALHVRMVVPAGMIDIDETDSPFHQTPRQQAVAGERRLSLLGAVHFQRRRTLPRQVHEFGSAALHAVGQFVGTDARGDLRIADDAGMVAVEIPQQVQRVPLEPIVDSRWIAHVEDRISLGSKGHALKHRGQESTAPVGLSATGPFPVLRTTNPGRSSASLPSP